MQNTIACIERRWKNQDLIMNNREDQYGIVRNEMTGLLRFPARLHQAALAGDKPTVKRLLLQTRDNISLDSETKRLCVHLAITSLDRALLSSVLDSGYDVTQGLNRQDDNALHLVLRSPCPDLTFLRRILQEMGPNVIDNKNLRGETPLHLAAAKSQVEPAAALLSAGASVNAIDMNGDTPLHIAIGSDHTRMICLLLVYKANLICDNNQLDSPVTMAAKKRQLNVLRLLLRQNFTSNKRIEIALTRCLVDAVLKGDSELVYLMLKKGATVNGLMRGKDTVLHIAASRGDKALVQLLVKAEANVNAMADGVMALHCAAQRGHTEVVKVLLENKASVNAPLDDPSLGMTAIHLATAGNHLPVVDLLLSFGANVNAQDGSGNTSLHTAASLPDLPSLEPANFTPSPPEDIVTRLLESGADSSQRNYSKDMPHHIAAHRGHRWKLQKLLQAGCPLEARDGYGDTALASAMINQRLELVIMLLAHGAKTQVIIEEFNPMAHIDDQSLLIYKTVINSGNLLDEEEVKLRKKLKSNSGKQSNKLVETLSRGSCLNLKTLTRSFIRGYLLRTVCAFPLYQSIDGLQLPSLIKRYLLLQDYMDASLSMRK